MTGAHTLTADELLQLAIKLPADERARLAGALVRSTSAYADIGNGAERALQESEARYRHLFTESPQANLILVDGVFTDCNRGAQRLFDAPRDWIVGSRRSTARCRRWRRSGS